MIKPRYILIRSLAAPSRLAIIHPNCHGSESRITSWPALFIFALEELDSLLERPLLNMGVT